MDFDSLARENILLKLITDKMGWTSFLQIRERTYHNVVQAFYFKAEVFPDKSLIVSTIKGKKISLNPMVIAEKLKLPHDGACVYGDNWVIDLNVNLSEVIRNVFQPNTTEFFSSKLHYIPTMLNLLSQHSLIPRKGDHGNVIKNELLHIYHMF